ncbi:uncharacterized protein LOC113305602 [Papaver somniferum]|uniref:uncharacterized protein LOC113305602 n=1 Tax=Papaver somniferum TaxID=3469 RepID=UPI000E6FA227|nr:uncharacterized protein LOC113305602 [Papaver somniferum]
MEAVRCYWDLPWVIGGDFNEIISVHERSCEGEITARMRKLNNFIARHELYDLPLNEIAAISKQHFGDLDSRMEELEGIFMTLDAEENTKNGMTEEQWDERLQARQKFCKLDILKAEKWRTRSRITHMKLHDDNTKYFHILATDRRRMSYIGAIKVNDAVTVDEKKIKKPLLNIFRKIFSNKLQENMDSMNFNKITEEVRIWIESEVTEDECLHCMKNLGQNKAPGPDGIPIIFYVLCWDIIKKDTTLVFKELTDKNLYWRQILYGVLVANEIIDSRIRSGRPGILVKVDSEKAFDHVRWDFLDEMLSLMGFGENLRKWTQRYVEYVRFSILISGSATGYFKSKKGIRQGDPLSFFFLLVGEAMSFMIQKAQENGLISGFQATEGGNLISHLQFSDDTLVLLDADIEQVKHLRLLLLSFEQLTGLKINFAKSQIFGVGYTGDLAHFSSVLGCYYGVLPTTYLGFPLGNKSGGVAKWDKIIDRIIARLAGWIKSFLSRAGKITLTNSVLSSLHVYYMSLFVMPTSVAKRTERIMRNFLWNDNKGKKKMKLVKWSKLCRRKKWGGLGIKSLVQMNKALLTKW